MRTPLQEPAYRVQSGPPVCALWELALGEIFNSLLAAVGICGCNLGVQTSYSKEVIVSVMGLGGISPR